MSETPVCDAHIIKGRSGDGQFQALEWVEASIARILERRLLEAEEKLREAEELVKDAQEELRLCQQDAIRLSTSEQRLREAAKHVQCSCALAQRENRHLVDCWMPDLLDALQQES